ncbi:MAG TPA: DUF6390 family protein [Acidimicrobiales bacterium]|nr:DUF6390 family protein [Acidimicrobiales bacterium]
MDEPVTAPGPVLFARYAYPPNALGYCGPADPEGLLGAAAAADAAAAVVDVVEVEALADRAAHFTGAWPYLRLIAASNDVLDPLDARVVDAYWVGNALLDRVPPAGLAEVVDAQLELGHGPAAAAAPGTVPAGGHANHSFHVFAVYPWLGLLRSGMEGPPLMVLDRCRIRWGTVEAVDADAATVRSRTLRFSDGRLELGHERVEDVRYRIDGVGFVGDLAPGDSVSMHWDWVCERLSPARRERLQASTERSLGVVNALDA